MKPRECPLFNDYLIWLRLRLQLQLWGVILLSFSGGTLPKLTAGVASPSKRRKNQLPNFVIAALFVYTIV